MQGAAGAKDGCEEACRNVTGTAAFSPQLKKLDQAVSAAHTFFVANPQHLQMREDIEKYRRMSGVKSDNFRDLEATPHWVRVRCSAGHHQLLSRPRDWSEAVICSYTSAMA